MPMYEDNLIHWGLAKGDKASNHKYYAREEINGNSKNKYKYFYTKEAFDKFKSGVKDVGSTLKKNFNSYKSDWASGAKQISDSAKKVSNSYKTSYSSGLKQLGDRGKSISNKIFSSTTGQSAKKYLDLYKTGLGLKTGSKMGVVDDNKYGPNAKVVDRNKEGKHKYVAKVKLANGKTRYFYDKKQYDRWQQTQYYQNTEPKYLKDIKEIEPSEDGKMPTYMEDSANVNHQGNTEKDPKRYVNCVYCSLTQEYRRRGYDVEAKSKISTSKANDIADWYDGLKIENDTVKLDERQQRQYEALMKKVGREPTPLSTFKENDNVKNVDNVKDFLKTIDDINAGKVKDADTLKDYGNKVKASTDAKIDEFPNGSRGSINLYWLKGGGHSITWEKDASGKITYVDTQSNKQINFEDYASNTSPFTPINIVRVDNLQLSEKSRNYIQPRT